jgi:hypothetical protein
MGWQDGEIMTSRKFSETEKGKEIIKLTKHKQALANFAYKQGMKDERQALMSEIEKIIDDYQPYPEDIFTPTGKSDDARFGTFGRQVVINVKEYIRKELAQLFGSDEK